MIVKFEIKDEIVWVIATIILIAVTTFLLICCLFTLTHWAEFSCWGKPLIFNDCEHWVYVP